MTRDELRQGLIQRGWFHDGQLSDSGGLLKAAYTDENNALRALKTRNFLAFNRAHVWLV